MIPGQIVFFLKHDMKNCCFVTWKFGLTFPKIWNRLRLIHLAKNIKKSCYLARLPIDLRFICLSHSVILRWWRYFPYLPPELLTPPLHIGMLFPTVFCCCFYIYFTWRWFDDFYYFYYFLLNVLNQNFVCASSRAGWELDPGGLSPTLCDSTC